MSNLIYDYWKGDLRLRSTPSAFLQSSLFNRKWGIQIILLVLCVASVTNSFGQTISGTVLDKTTTKSLLYVHIGIVGKNMGTISDANGRFSIDVSRAATDDVLRFSSIGYQTQDFVVGKLKPEQLFKIELQRETFSLPEVSVVTSRTVATEDIGFTNATKTTFGWNGYEWKGTELGVPIRGIQNQLAYEFNFYLRFNLYKESLFRLNIYTLKDGLPHESILRENIFFTIGKDKKWISVDLRPYQLVIPGDVIVSIEPIRTAGENGGFFFSYAENSGDTPTLMRQSSQSSWDVGYGNAAAFYLTVEKN